MEGKGGGSPLSLVGRIQIQKASEPTMEEEEEGMEGLRG